MTDDHLRALERAYRETGSQQVETAWLRARLQAGVLEQSFVEVAAYLGHKPAMLALSDRVSETPKEPRDLANGLQRWGLRVTGLTAFALARLCRAEWEQEVPTDGLAQAAVAALESWLREPTQQNAETANKTGLTFVSEARQRDLSARQNQLATSVFHACCCPIVADCGGPTDSCYRGTVADWLSMALEPAEQALSSSTVRNAITNFFLTGPSFPKGGLELAAQALAVRRQGGEVTEAALRLAAELGDPASRWVLGAEAPVQDHAWWDAGRIWEVSHETCVRAAIALAAWSLEQDGGSLPLAQAAIDAARDWIDCPCLERADRCLGLGDRVRRHGARYGRWAPGRSLVGFCVCGPSHQQLAARPPRDRVDAARQHTAHAEC